MFKIEDEATESALCVGIVAALVWGIGLSVYAFQLGPGEEVSWTQWGAQLMGGILACLIVPVAWVRGTAWLTGKLGPHRVGAAVEQE